nr:hypothetical protein [Tanacetum cinerariifolium]
DEARVGNTAGDVLERDLLPIVQGSYYILYPYNEGFGSKSPPYTKDDWEDIHGVNLGVRKKELYKDPKLSHKHSYLTNITLNLPKDPIYFIFVRKLYRTALDRFLTLAETHRLRELSSVEFPDRMSVLQCQLIAHGSMLNARYDHSLRNVECLSKQYAQQTHTIKRKIADLKQQNEST